MSTRLERRLSPLKSENLKNLPVKPHTTEVINSVT